jgi:hypothetical protein
VLRLFEKSRYKSYNNLGMHIKNAGDVKCVEEENTVKTHSPREAYA